MNQNWNLSHFAFMNQTTVKVMLSQMVMLHWLPQLLLLKSDFSPVLFILWCFDEDGVDDDGGGSGEGVMM